MDINELKRLADKFWARVDKSADCWIWTGGKSQEGYGVLRFQGKTSRAHRVAYLLSVGTIAKDMMICHRCDNPSCVRPEHLYAGTAKQNAQDMTARSRCAAQKDSGFARHARKHQVGESHPRVKLTAADVCVMRGLRMEGMSFKMIAQRYSVFPSTARAAITGATWSELSVSPVTTRTRSTDIRTLRKNGLA